MAKLKCYKDIPSMRRCAVSKQEQLLFSVVLLRYLLIIKRVKRKTNSFLWSLFTFCRLPTQRCCFSATREMLLCSYPTRGTLKLSIEITKKGWLSFDQSSVLGLNKSRLAPNSDGDFVCDIWQKVLFPTFLTTAFLFCYPTWIVIPHLKRRDSISFLLRIVLPLYITVLAGLGLFPSLGLCSVRGTMGPCGISEPLDAAWIVILVQQLPPRLLNY